MSDDTETPKCFKCGHEPVGPGGILGADCKAKIEDQVAHPWR
ncbi:hypothetical protein [Amycolatopsis sp. CFH S0078]|nr:hypothetical protein [Amycolatopsis sp. CFH S0078]